jgi:arylsulfatase A-like enzyme
MITENTQIEEIVQNYDVIPYFIKCGVSPISCSGAFPQSLGNFLRMKKVTDPVAFIDGLNSYISGQKADDHYSIST